MSWLWGLIGATTASFIKPVGGTASDSSQTASSSPGGFDPLSKLTFEETVAQMQRGYENAQRVVQFMDAKAGAVIAFSLTIFGFVSNIVAWVYGVSGSGFLLKMQAPQCFIFWVLIVLLVVEMVSGGVCLYRAFMTVRPNGLPDPKRFTTLFPARENASNQPDAQAYLMRVIAGESRSFILSEFKNQLLDMGGIVFRKIRELQKAIWALIWQGVTAVVIGAVIAGSASFGCLGGKSAATSSEPVTEQSKAHSGVVSSKMERIRAQ